MIQFDTALAELCAYTGLEQEQALARMASAYRQQIAEWDQAPRSTVDEIVDFYRKTDSYLFELVEFNYRHAAYQVWRQLIRDAVRSRAGRPQPLRVLDYGGGIGSILLDLADLPNLRLTYADIPGQTFAYAAWRFRQHLLPVQMLDASRPDQLGEESYDVIISLEVVDHVPDPLGLANYLVDHLADKGLLILSCNFNDNGGEARLHLNTDRLTSADVYAAIAARGLHYDNTVMPRFFTKQ